MTPQAVTPPAGIPSAAPTVGHPGLLAALVAAVRPQFRADVIDVDPVEPVFGGAACRVPGCERVARGNGMCAGHNGRWRSQGKPDLERFVTSTAPQRWGHAPLRACRRRDVGTGSGAPGCAYGIPGSGTAPDAPTSTDEVVEEALVRQCVPADCLESERQRALGRSAHLVPRVQAWVCRRDHSLVSPEEHNANWLSQLVVRVGRFLGVLDLRRTAANVGVALPQVVVKHAGHDPQLARKPQKLRRYALLG